MGQCVDYFLESEILLGCSNPTRDLLEHCSELCCSILGNDVMHVVLFEQSHIVLV